MTKHFSSGPWLAPTVPELLRMSEGQEALDAILTDTLNFLRSGQGRYDTDGVFDRKQLLYGKPVVIAGPAHRRLRAALCEDIRYFQGLTHVVEKLDAEKLVPRHVETPMIFEEVHMNRTKMLANRFYKGEGAGVTLSNFTKWGVTNTFRNRARLRDVIALVFEHYAVWHLLRDADGYAMATSGQLLKAFSTQVLDHLPDIDDKDDSEGDDK